MKNMKSKKTAYISAHGARSGVDASLARYRGARSASRAGARTAGGVRRQGRLAAGRPIGRPKCGHWSSPRRAAARQKKEGKGRKSGGAAGVILRSVLEEKLAEPSFIFFGSKNSKIKKETNETKTYTTRSYKPNVIKQTYITRYQNIQTLSHKWSINSWCVSSSR
jgi:hypothetical protein